MTNMIDFGLDVQQAVEALRIEHVGSASPKGGSGRSDGGLLEIERGFSPAVVEELKRRGHNVAFTLFNGGGYQGILIDPTTAHCTAARNAAATAPPSATEASTPFMGMVYST